VEILLREAGPADIVCFHAQQCVEKILKSFLLANGSEPPKIHDLSRLISLAIDLDPEFSQLTALCVNLNEYYIEPRYPILPKPSTHDESTQAHNDARTILDFTLEKIRSSTDT
jgi:HEPN domain-containing protein